MKTKLPELIGTHHEKMLIQRQRNAIIFDRNAAQIRKNARFLKWFGWFDRLTGGNLRYETAHLVDVDASLHEVDLELQAAIEMSGQ